MTHPVFLVLLGRKVIQGPRGAMVARLTPDQKAGCSSHPGVIVYLTTSKRNGIVFPMLSKP